MTTALASPSSPIRTGPQGLPEHTLAWQIFGWTHKYLRQPDGPDAGEPWVFTDEQARFVAWWYAVDLRGRFVYRRGMFRRMKGHGKDPFAGALCCIEFVGPCRFGGWRANGEPIAVPHTAAWVQVAAVSKDQTRNTMTLFPGMLSDRAVIEYDIDMGKEIYYAKGQTARLEAVSSSPRALEGGRTSFTVKNETHHWIASNEGHAMADVIARNAAKSRDGASRVLSISNAHAPGEDSDAERDWEAFNVDPTGFLYDSLEAPAFDFSEEDPGNEKLRDAIIAARGDSVWLDLDRLIEEIRAPETEENTARRYYLNQLAAAEDRAFDFDHWRSLAILMRLPYPRAKIALGFDGSVNDDWTALIATELDRGYQWPIGIWKPERGADGVWRIDVDAVMAAIHGAFDYWDVRLLAMDPYYWTEQLNALMGRYNEPGNIRVREFNTTDLKLTAKALLAYNTAMKDGVLSHPDDPDFNFGIRNSFRKTQSFVDDNGDPMWTIRKEHPGSQLKIDPAMAGAISWWAHGIAVAKGALEERQSVYEERGFLTL